MASPLEQFEVTPIVPIQVGGLDLSFTNASLFMVINVAIVTVILITATSGRALVPSRMQSLGEIFYEGIANMIRDNVGSGGRAYFPFIFTLFMFVLTCNLVGMIPGSFTVTSHIIVNFSLAAVMGMKIWHWMEMQRHALTREIKRVELQVANLANDQ